MKLFLKKIAIYISVIILLIVGSYGFNRYLIYISGVLSIKPNINKIILGASRTACGVNDNIVDGALNLSSNADALFYSMIKLRITVNENPQIDTVIICLDNRTLDEEISKRFLTTEVSIKSRLPKYSAYFTFNEWIELFKINKIACLKSVFKIPKYSLKLLKSLFKEGQMNILKLGIGGFYNLEGEIVQSDIDQFNSNLKKIKYYELSQVEIKKLLEIKRFCKQNRIELVFVNPPLYSLIRNCHPYNEGRLVFQRFFNKYLSEYVYLDFSNDTLPDDCYADLVHLNSKGAEIFSRKWNSELQVLSSSVRSIDSQKAIVKPKKCQ